MRVSAGNQRAALQTLNVRRAPHSAELNFVVSSFCGSASISSAVATGSGDVVAGGILGASWEGIPSISGATGSRIRCQYVSMELRLEFNAWVHL